MTANSWSLGGKLCCLCVVLVPLVLAAPVQAKGTFTILPANVLPYSINDSGVVAGVDINNGFVRTPDGTVTTFSAADNAVTVPRSINNAGVTTGAYSLSDGVGHGFLRAADGTITSFDVPGAGQAKNQGTFPFRINAAGAVTGSYTDQSGNSHGFVRAANGTITSIDVPGALEVFAMGINDKGEIAGYWSDTIDHGFLRAPDGTITSFDAPEGVSGTDGDAINNKGVITGVYLDQKNLGHGYVRQPDGTFTTFDVAGALDTYPAAINAKGTISGVLDHTNIRFQGYVRYRNGKTKAIVGPNANGGTYVNGMNKDGVLTGDFLTRPDHHSPYSYYGFIWTP